MSIPAAIRDGACAVTISLWEDQTSIDKLASLLTFQETMRRMEETGILEGE
ncbi:MAG: hypothetical protein ACC700_11140 [Anaerolineales bacterium]